MRMIVEEVMSRDVITLSPQDKIESALKLLNEHRIRHIPITNDENKSSALFPIVTSVMQLLPYWPLNKIWIFWRVPFNPLCRVLLLPHILLISLKILLHYSMITKLRVCLLRMQINSLVSSRRKIFSTH